MAKSCKGLATELVKCLSESDCIKVENRPYRECAKEQSPNISSECVGLRETYFNCKRGQIKYEDPQKMIRCSKKNCIQERIKLI
ncbi:cytochrome c oxidase assembly factor 5-like isoform X2 [Salvia hispanica]|uniref:cytochrome c oxidase assembly factor 5-like isoform X2 n=1 Tax=Salvia hispanica TaxID=49212 RepID=UPI0020093FA7|nr:cytochrome c oxidase assembly factor 5-like isoform X2 [Salvia hispanica]XP_047982774.1 cytochrome c oxidase assembly factor 5-like isoform X2 [Salvia hispanica]